MKELVEIDYWTNDLIKICYVMDWDRKGYLLDEHDSIVIGNEISNRDTHTIIDSLKGNNNIMLFAIGIESRESKNFPSINSASKFSFTASFLW